MRPVVGADELRGDAQLVAVLAHAAFQQVGDAELGADRAQVLVLALERETRGASHQPQRRHLCKLVEDFLGQAVAQVFLIVRLREVGKGQHGHGGPCIRDCGGCGRCGRVCRRRCCVVTTFAGALVVPERPAAEDEQQRNDRELGTADPLLAAIAVVPGDDQHDGQANQQREAGELLQLLGPVQKRADVGEALKEAPGARDVGDAPLHHLAAAQSGPGAVALPLARVAHALLPVATECSGIASRRSLECLVPGRSGHGIKDRSWPTAEVGESPLAESR